ncbi:MAG: hypothetical protein OXC05_00965 [Halieaceae bacterium]|nr:hypothetical protein [Halieaceae bacterium]
MNMRQEFSPKLVIYGIGFVGQELTRLAHAKGWDIVAAYNRAGEKVGQDLGRLASLDKDLGVTVQDCDTADYSSLDADVALIASTDFLEQNFPAYQRFLGRGINVLCHGGESYHPRWMNREVAKKIEALAKKNEVTFTGSGIWDMTRIWSGIICAGPCVRIDSIEHNSATEIGRQGSQFVTLVGAGMTVEEFDEKLGRKALPFSQTLQIPSVAVLQQYGYTVTDVDTRQEPVLWDEPVYCPELDKELVAGVSVGLRVLIDVFTQEGVKASSCVEWRVFREDEEELMHWRVNGLPGMEITVKREDSGVASASSLFNRIPHVIAAEPGIVELMNLGPEKPSVLL